MQVRIRRADCCGHAMCVEIAPDVFTIDADNKSIVIDEGAAPLATVIEAAEACPCQAIVVEDDEGRRLA
jgi:ferredoxin